MKRFLVNTCLGLLCFNVFGQLATNRMKSHYRLDSARLRHMEDMGFRLMKIPPKEKEETPVRYALGDLKTFKFLATLKEGAILVDPWSFNRTDVNMTKKDELHDGYTLSYLSKHTPITLQIDLKRDSAGAPTKVLKIPYQAWVLTVNTLGIKVRPSATDSAEKNYAPSVTAAFNLGLTMGYSFGKTAFTHRTQISTSHTFGAGFGFSSINLSKEPLIGKVTVDATQNNFVLSPNLSYTIARNDLGFMLAAGFDLMAGAHADSWLYQRKFFWGFGVALGLKV